MEGEAAEQGSVKALFLAGVLLLAPSALALSEPEPRRIGLMGDAQEEGERPGFRAAIRDLEAMGGDLLLFGGDTSYGWGAPERDWLDALGPYQDRTLFVVGNHDNGKDYARWFPESANRTWWRHELADGIVLVALDTEQPLREGDEQRAWLESTLAAHADDLVVLIMHIAWWAPNEHHKDALDFPGNASDLDALVARYDVDLVLAAHEHYYARIKNDGVPYVVNGAVEARTREVPGPLAERAAAHGSVAVWMRLDVLPCGVAAWTQVVEGGVFDSFGVQHDAADATLAVGAANATCVPNEPAPTTPAPTLPSPGAAGDAPEARAAPAPGFAAALFALAITTALRRSRARRGS